MQVNTELRHKEAPGMRRNPIAQLFSFVRNSLHVILLIVPAVLWCAWCVWGVFTLLTSSIRVGARRG